MKSRSISPHQYQNKSTQSPSVSSATVSHSFAYGDHHSQAGQQQEQQRVVSHGTPLPPPPPPALKPKLIVDKEEILRKMEERRLEEEARVKGQEEASKRKLQELEARLSRERQRPATGPKAAEGGCLPSWTTIPPLPVPDTLPTFSFGQKKRLEARPLAESNVSQTCLKTDDVDTDNDDEFPVVPPPNAPLKDLLGITTTQTISVVSGDVVDEFRSPTSQQKSSTWKRPNREQKHDNLSPDWDVPVTIHSTAKGLHLKEGYDALEIKWTQRRRMEAESQHQQPCSRGNGIFATPSLDGQRYRSNRLDSDYSPQSINSSHNGNSFPGGRRGRHENTSSNGSGKNGNSGNVNQSYLEYPLRGSELEKERPVVSRQSQFMKQDGHDRQMER